jgi:hypothetical protein
LLRLVGNGFTVLGLPFYIVLIINHLKIMIMARGKSLKAPKVDLKTKKQEKIKQKLEAQQTRKRR